jgi:F-type H+-transporting ATPase subunit delta
MQSRAAIRYAKAIFEIAIEENAIENVFNDMNVIDSLSNDSSDFRNLLTNSQIKYQDKKNAILSLIESYSGLTVKLIDLLINNKRVYIVNDIAKSFIQLYNRHNDIKEAVVITATPINKDLEEKILSKINVADIKSINLKNIVDPSILGGFIIRFDGKEYNASVKQNLNNLKTELTN